MHEGRAQGMPGGSAPELYREDDDLLCREHFARWIPEFSHWGVRAPACGERATALPFDRLEAGKPAYLASIPPCGRCRTSYTACMTLPVRAPLLVLVLVAGLETPGSVAAQNNFEIQVYGSETRGTRQHDDGIAQQPGRGGHHENHRPSPSNAGCFPRDAGDHSGLDVLVRDRLLCLHQHPARHHVGVGGRPHPPARVRTRELAPAGGAQPLGGVGYQRRAFSTDTWTLELRPIVDKQWGRLRPYSQLRTA